MVEHFFGKEEVKGPIPFVGLSRRFLFFLFCRVGKILFPMLSHLADTDVSFLPAKKHDYFLISFGLIFFGLISFGATRFLKISSTKEVDGHDIVAL